MRLYYLIEAPIGSFLKPASEDKQMSISEQNYHVQILWLCYLIGHPNGNRTHIAAVKGRWTKPLFDGAMVGRIGNDPISKGLQPNANPSQLSSGLFMVGREGICTFTELTAVLQTVELTRAQPTQMIGTIEIWTHSGCDPVLLRRGFP